MVKFFLALLVLGVQLLPAVQGLRCYVCNHESDTHTKCDPSSSEIIETTSEDERCISFSAMGSLMKQDIFTTSECEAKVEMMTDELRAMGSATFKCCDTDLCNTMPDESDLAEIKERVKARQQGMRGSLWGGYPNRDYGRPGMEGDYGMDMP